MRVRAERKLGGGAEGQTLHFYEEMFVNELEGHRAFSYCQCDAL